MTPPAPVRAALLVLGLSGLGGCAAISSIDAASQSLDTFELTPVAAADAGSFRSGRVIQVDVPVASGGVGTDRILIKPGPLRVAYLPDGRWVDPAPVHVQSLMVRSLAGTGRFGFVGGQSTGPLPDYVLLTDLQAFQAEVAPEGAAAPVEVVLSMTVTILRDIDRRVIATRSFERRAAAPNDDALTVARAFDAAMRPLLADLVGWTLAVVGGGAGA